MALRILKTISNENINLKTFALQCVISRNGHKLRGKPPGIARSLEQRLNEINYVDPEIAHKIDIGFPVLKLSRSVEIKERLKHVKEQRSNSNLEKLARTNNLNVDLQNVKSEWYKTGGPYQIKKIAEHYGVFEHLFGAAYFIPQVKLDIHFKADSKGELLNPVYYGNVLKPKDTKAAPQVQFDSSFSFSKDKNDAGKTSLWTLVCTNPDYCTLEDEREICHWFIGNIPNSDLNKGEEIVSFLQPVPIKGFGWQRYIFILYKQEKKLDFSDFKIKQENNLDVRKFKTFDFYKKYQDDMTPAGLAFFQSDWDESMIDFYHNVLKTKMPTVEYDLPKPYIREQEWFPLRRPFNLYMDKYRDPKQINREYLQRAFSKTHPFNGPEPELRFPNAHSIKDVPSWLKTEMKKDRLKWGRINDLGL
uniref:Large ribosomal subunit protein mL38 n=1 Tax=Corethrella appendiculata TaxID=1370023 RepID=U5ERQ6_9DIPT